MTGLRRRIIHKGATSFFFSCGIVVLAMDSIDAYLYG